ncbi:MAG: serine/threonine protein kinase [Proteobacteria bacterium]|nr:serine/threonine protein kinase [Pseudomonadota bacterium]
MVAAKHLEEHDPASDFKAGHVFGDRFRVEKLIAAGGMGFVYLATDLNQDPQQPVALKIMRSSLQRDPIAIERFKREVRTIKRLMHPNTIELIDYGVTEDGFMFLVMEWLYGKDLREIMRIKKNLSPITATRVALQVSWSLSEAHMKGIIHRDLKPENIFIMHNPGPHLRIKVVDFGLAKVVSGPESAQQITRGGVVCGTPEYMSPEQAKGEQLDGRSDVYALGCVMYAMLEGDAPFRGKKAIDIAMMHINHPFPQMSEKVPQQLKDIILKCVEKKPAARFQNVNELAIALEAFLDPIECRRRESGDAWTVRRSTPPGGEYMCTPDVSAEREVIQAKSVLAAASDTSSDKQYTPASQKAVRRVKSSQLAAERAAKRKPFNSQCIRLKTNPTLQSHAKLKSAEPPKREGIFKRFRDKFL